MYFSDTHRHTIWACDYDRASGAISGERVFADADDLHPDGACVDAEGCLWSCQYGGWRIVRYTPAGKVDRVIELPLANPTCCCFGGDALDTLYVTSATQKLAPRRARPAAARRQRARAAPGREGPARIALRGLKASPASACGSRARACPGAASAW